MVTVVQFLATLGVLLSIPYVHRFLSFIWLYFGRPSAVQNYRHGSKPYALVTGATDGIGKALAGELYGKGFNLILHGRNEEKMRKVIADLRKTGSQDVLYFIADATKDGHDFVAMIEPFKNLHITLVIHNVGGTIRNRERIDGWSEEELINVIRWNAIFPLFLTRTLLPTLRNVAKQGPVLVNFIGSLAADACPPRLAVYAGSKAFLEKLTRVLDTDEQVWDEPTGVHFMYHAVGEVVSSTMITDVTLTSPSSETFAKSAVARLGCGRKRVTSYMIHAALQWIMELIGQRAVDYYVRKAIYELFKSEAKNA